MNIQEHDSLHSRGRALEDAFFAERDQHLREALRRSATAEETERNLAVTLGVDDKMTLQALTEAGGNLRVSTAVALLPLVEVAWCDGAVSQREREAILRAAAEFGMAPASATYQLLESWLQVRPSPEVVSVWREYVRALCATLQPQAVQQLKRGVLTRAEQVAQAAGGLLGLSSKISALERLCLDDLATNFQC
jgi:hypothetical protein